MATFIDENRKLKEQIEQRHGKSVEALYGERVRRIRDAIELRVPDRVPVVLGTGVFAARYGFQMWFREVIHFL